MWCAEMASIRTPSVKELQSAGITFDIIIPYISACHERSVLQNVDLKTAAYGIVQTIREYRQLESLQKGVEKAEQQLSALNTFTTQKQQAISRRSNLAGFSEKDITELIALVDRWNKQWPGIGSPGLDQGNGSSSMNGSKLDDRLIRH
jgi:hypothetical protein